MPISQNNNNNNNYYCYYFFANEHKAAGLKLSNYTVWLQRRTNLAVKCLRMRLHFLSAKPRTASETGRWFLCCPLWWQWCVSRFLAPVQLLAGFMIPLSRWQLGKRCVSFQVQVPDTLQSCCLLPVSLPLPAHLQWSSDSTPQKYQLMAVLLLMHSAASRLQLTIYGCTHKGTTQATGSLYQYSQNNY